MHIKKKFNAIFFFIETGDSISYRKGVPAVGPIWICNPKLFICD